MDRAAWWATVQGVAELDMTSHTHMWSERALSVWFQFFENTFLSFFKHIVIQKDVPGSYTFSSAAQEASLSLNFPFLVVVSAHRGQDLGARFATWQAASLHHCFTILCWFLLYSEVS